MNTIVQNIHTPLVTVIIPSYNHAQYIENAIDSVLSQTYKNLELIVIDDGSKDNTHSVVQNCATDPRVTLILNTKNHGQSYVLNRALEIAKGEFICLLPSDDWMLPKKLELQVAKFRKSSPEVGVVYCKGQRYFEDTAEYVDVNHPVYTGWVAKYFITWGPFVYPVTPMFRKECFEVARPNEKYKAEGEAIYISIALHFQFEYVDQVLAVMRDHSYNIGKDADVMYDEVRDYWIDFFNRDDLPVEISKLKSTRFERLNRVKGMQFIVDKRNFTKGRLCLARALKNKPMLIFKPKFTVALIITLLPNKLGNLLLNRIKPKEEQS